MMEKMEENLLIFIYPMINVRRFIVQLFIRLLGVLSGNVYFIICLNVSQKILNRMYLLYKMNRKARLENIIPIEIFKLFKFIGYRIHQVLFFRNSTIQIFKLYQLYCHENFLLAYRTFLYSFFPFSFLFSFKNR